MKGIPKLLHQTYASTNLPPRLSRFQITWKQHHPEWEYRLWSDEDIREFFSHHYSWFIPIFNDYPHPIMRVDAFRYFLLYHYGGFYADLDSECFSSLNPLIEKNILLTEESSAHIQKGKAHKRGLPYIVSNAFMGSMPKHSFWSHVIDLLQKNKDAWDLLDATGPFMLTKAHASYRPKIPLLPSHYFCSLADERLTSGRQKQDKISQPDEVYAVHHWFGSWWKTNSLQFLMTGLIKVLIHRFASLLLPNYKIRAYLAAKDEGENLPSRRVITYRRGSIVEDQPWDLRENYFEDRADLPLVSALLITKNRKEQALRAIECFLAQTYDAKELVIIDEGERELEKAIKKLASPLISYHRNDKRINLGQLRNQAIRIAKGEYVCQWDDDDLYHPAKISHQLAICEEKKADACFLLRELLLDQPRMSLGISDYRLWEGTILARKDKILSYPAWRRGEDYWVVHRLAQRGTVVALDWPELYLYIYHGSNTWDRHHFARVWAKATRLYFLDNEDKLKELTQPYPHINQLVKP